VSANASRNCPFPRSPIGGSLYDNVGKVCIIVGFNKKNISEKILWYEHCEQNEKIFTLYSVQLSCQLTHISLVRLLGLLVL